MARLAATRRPTTALVGDVFVWRTDGPGDAEANAGAIRAAIAAGAACRGPSAASWSPWPGPRGMQHFTFRPGRAAATPRRRSSAARTR